MLCDSVAGVSYEAGSRGRRSPGRHLTTLKRTPATRPGQKSPERAVVLRSEPASAGPASGSGGSAADGYPVEGGEVAGDDVPGQVVGLGDVGVGGGGVA